MAEEECADVILLNETHLDPGNSCHLPGFKMLFSTRPSKDLGYRKGGVAVAVRDGLCAREPVLMAECELGDAMCVRLALRDSAVPLQLVSVYLPPDYSTFCCECLEPSCSKCNVDATLAFVADCVREGAGAGPVFVAGDFNAHCERGGKSRRWRAVDRHLIREGMRVTNPLKEGGHGNPRAGTSAVTGTDTSGKLLAATRDNAVLDLALFAAGAVSGDGLVYSMAGCDTQVLEDLSISDHRPLLSALKLPMLTPMAAPPSQHVGPPVPASLASKPVSLPASRRRPVRRGEAPMEAKSLSLSVLEMLPPCDDARLTPGELLQEFQRAVARCVASPDMWEDPGSSGRGVTAWATTGGEEHCTRMRELERAVHLRLLTMRREVDEAKRRGAAIGPVTSLHRKALRELSWKCRAHRRAGREAQLAAAVQAGDYREVARLLNDTVTGQHPRAKPVSNPQEAAQSVATRASFLSIKYASPEPTPELAARVALIREAYATSRASADSQAAGAGSASDGAEVTVDDVRAALSRMRSGASALQLTAPALKAVCGDDRMCTWIAGVFQRILQSGAVPAELCVLRATLLPKNRTGAITGDLTQHRIIAVASSMSKLLQIVACAKLEKVLHPQISECQFGGMPGRSTSKCSFVLQTATELARQRGNTVLSVFLDFKTAFASCDHNLLRQAMHDAGVGKALWQYTDSFLEQQHIFVKMDGEVSVLVPVRIGVPEGCVASPLQFGAVINAAIKEINEAAEAAGSGLHTANGKTSFCCLFYCDDGVLSCTNTAALQVILDVCTRVMARIKMRLNMLPTKTALMVHPPVLASGRVCRKPTPEVELKLCGEVLQSTKLYPHLALHRTPQGGREDVKQHMRHIVPTIHAVTRAVWTSTVKRESILTGLAAYRTYWWPRVTFGLHLLTADAARDLRHLEVLEARLFKTLLGSTHLPNAVARSALGVPSLQTRNDLARFKEFVGLMSTPASQVVRRTIADAAQHLESLPEGAEGLRNRLFQGGLAKLMDATELLSDQITDLMEATMTPDVQYAPPPGFVAAVKTVLLAFEQERRQAALAELPSVAGVLDLLDSPNAMPFLREPRTVGNQLRARSLGEVRVLFGYEASEGITACPHAICRVGGGFSIRHLVTRCTSTADVRAQSWAEALQYLGGEGMIGVELQAAMQPQGDSSGATGRQAAEMLYRLTMGASVSDEYVKLGLMRETHFACDKTQSPPQTAQQGAVYTRVLSITAKLLEAVFARTREAITLIKGPAVMSPPVYGRRL